MDDGWDCPGHLRARGYWPPCMLKPTFRLDEPHSVDTPEGKACLSQYPLSPAHSRCSSNAEGGRGGCVPVLSLSGPHFFHLKNGSGDWLRAMAGCLGPPPQSIRGRPDPQCDGVRRRGPWSQKEQLLILALVAHSRSPTSLHKSCPQHEPKAGIREPKSHPEKAEPIPTFCLGSS